VSTAVFWWLGQRLAYLRANFTALVSEFQFGLIILIITFLVASQFGIELAGSVYLVLLFSLFALLGMSIAHALEGTSWLSGLFQGHWSGLLLVSILLQLILAALKWVLAMVMKGVFFIAGKIIPFLSSLMPAPEPVEMPPLMPTPDITEPLVEVRQRLIPEWVTGGLRIAWTVMVLGFVVFALWRVSSQIFSWLQRKLAGMSGAEFGFSEEHSFPVTPVKAAIQTGGKNEAGFSGVEFCPPDLPPASALGVLWWLSTTPVSDAV